MLDYDLPFASKTLIPKRHGRFQPFIDSKSEQWTTWYMLMKGHMPYGGLYGFIGKRGTGKTQMAVSLIGHVFYNMKDEKCLYYKYADLMELLRADGRAHDFYTKLLNAKALVIDACEVRKQSGYEFRELNRLADKRYDMYGKTTILISNDQRGEFEKFLGASIVSRMNEIGGIMEFKGESFRDKTEEQ